jgi:hypothetical protein
MRCFFLQLGGAGKLVFKDLGLRAGNMLFLDSSVEMCFYKMLSFLSWRGGGDGFCRACWLDVNLGPEGNQVHIKIITA